MAYGNSGGMKPNILRLHTWKNLWLVKGCQASLIRSKNVTASGL